MKTKDLTVEALVALNIAVSAHFENEFGINRPHNLKLLQKQSKQLQEKSDDYRFSYIASSLTKLKPFKSNNTRTAMLILAKYCEVNEQNAATIAGMLKHGTDAENLAAALVSK